MPPMTELQALIRQEIAASGGFLPFDRYMHLALYAPGLGYYARTAPMLSGGDFITAPEMTSLFGQTLAVQCAQIFEAGVAPHILEFGAGSGKLAHDLLTALGRLGWPQTRYSIIEVSGALQSAQRSTLSAFDLRIEWLTRLPESLDGIVLANEVLDAMPVQVFAIEGDQVFERGVGLAEDRLVWLQRRAREKLDALVLARVSNANRLECRTNAGAYISEIGLQAEAFVASIASKMHQGMVLLIDYGFGASEFYHPQRNAGTLMCFAQHRSHPDPLHDPGKEDITAHVDFSAIADAAAGAGLQLAGYTSQARFLMNCGILDLLGELPREDARHWAQAVAPVQRLLSEAEMGELFKVIAFTKGLDQPLIGFARGDRSGTL
jgi:SAM-dependent MidA family methyltransferase